MGSGVSSDSALDWSPSTAAKIDSMPATTDSMPTCDQAETHTHQQPQPHAPLVRVVGFDVFHKPSGPSRDSFAGYNISVTSESGVTWETCRRWSDLKSLESSLQRSEAVTLQKHSALIPRLEHLSWDSMFNKLEPTFLTSRASQMEALLQALLTVFCVRFDSPPVGPSALRAFLAPGGVPGNTSTPRSTISGSSCEHVPPLILGSADASAPSNALPSLGNSLVPTQAPEARAIGGDSLLAFSMTSSATASSASASSAAKPLATIASATAASTAVAPSAVAPGTVAPGTTSASEMPESANSRPTQVAPASYATLTGAQMEAQAQAHLDGLAKPAGSLGVLEEWSLVLCRMQKTLSPSAEPQSVIVFCSDHGVKGADGSLSPFPQSVTQAVFRALVAGISATGVLTLSCGASLTVVDCGIDGDVSDAWPTTSRIRAIHGKVRRGTANITTEPAMDADSLTAALDVGRECIQAEVSRRAARVVAIGEVGIGNTTSAAALLAALTYADPAECCGRGTGLDDAGVSHKISVVESACALHSQSIVAMPSEAARAKEALRRMGGFELAAMVGAYIEAEREGLVAVVDGFISAVAALCAVRMEPACRRAMVFSTSLAEEPSKYGLRGGRILEAALDARTAISMNLRLGEASGAVLALPLVRAAAAIPSNMASLQSALSLGPAGATFHVDGSGMSSCRRSRWTYSLIAAAALVAPIMIGLRQRK